MWGVADEQSTRSKREPMTYGCWQAGKLRGVSGAAIAEHTVDVDVLHVGGTCVADSRGSSL